MAAGAHVDGTFGVLERLDIVMACTVMAYAGMAYIVMAYIVMAFPW